MNPVLNGYADVPSFIYGITREIWEDRGVGGKLAGLYAPNILLRAATGLTTDNTGVTSQTLQTLHQFPDRQLVGEDVIWTAYPDGSFLSSHRLISVTRHQGAGSYGAASGRLVRSRIIADCWVVNGVVTEEWLARDQAAFAICLGQTPRDLAQEMAEADLRRTGEIAFYSPARDVPGVYVPAVQDGAENYIADYRRLWGEKDISVLRTLYFHGAAVAIPGGETRFGHGDIDRFYLGYLASFPDAAFTVHGATVNRDPGRPLRVALRWSLEATHSGYGHFGAPTGAPVHVMGFSHAEFVDGLVRYEWVVTDEVAIWKQIIAHGLS